jgi:glycosyltransferase involved in cell wall biosynthesis
VQNKGSIKICHITTVHGAFDDRIFYKECVALADVGYDVNLVAPHNANEEKNGVKIIPLKEYSNPYKRIILAPPSALFKALKTKATIFHFHDPELLFVGVLLSIFGKKVIFDSHENVSGQILNKEWLFNSFFRKIIASVYRFFEIISAFFFSGIIAVNDEIADKFNKNKTIIVRNLPILNLIQSTNEQFVKRNANDNILIYSGGLTNIRGIKELVSAMDYIDAKLWILGQWESEEFKNCCEELQGWKKCEYIGYVPFGEHYKYIRSADIGIVPFLPIPNHENALPNKPFEYMACGIPIAMSGFKYWKEQFGDCAVYFDPTNCLSIADAINNLIKDKERSKKLGEKGREKVLNEMSWEKEKETLFLLYNRLQKNANTPN